MRFGVKAYKTELKFFDLIRTTRSFTVIKISEINTLGDCKMDRITTISVNTDICLS